MNGRTPVVPNRGKTGWSMGSGILPYPRDELRMWRVIQDIIDNRGGGVLVLAHHNADIDAVGTAIILKRSFPWLDIGAFRSVSHAGRSLLSHVGMEMKIDPDISRYSLLVIVDSSSTLQVSDGDLSGWPPYWVIDHHADHSHWDGNVYQDPSMGACVEIALQISFLSGAMLDDMMAVSAVAGVVADTGKFRFTKPVDLDVCSMVLEGSGIKMENVLGVIEGEEYFDVSKKIAQLKAMRRVRFEKVGDQIVATSMVSSYEAAAARALLVAGADVVFIAAERKNDLRISSRAKPHILALGVHLGHFMEEIGRETGNQGGGHDGAAGLNGKGSGEKALMLCMERMTELLAGKLGVQMDRKRDHMGGRRGKAADRQPRESPDMEGIQGGASRQE
ncbi:MAG: DHH family phosphoesterase [Candidatus Thermoplasmatota archaeon]|nr:DHH family phosphoesterase [Candidatus Thermoplasmatota archaeon]